MDVLVFTFPVRCRPLWLTLGWCKTCSHSQRPQTCVCAQRWGCPHPAAFATVPGWPCHPRELPGAHGSAQFWTDPLLPPFVQGNSGSVKRSGHFVFLVLTCIILQYLFHTCLTYPFLKGVPQILILNSICYYLRQAGNVFRWHLCVCLFAK